MKFPVLFQTIFDALPIYSLVHGAAVPHEGAPRLRRNNQDLWGLYRLEGECEACAQAALVLGEDQQ